MHEYVRDCLDLPTEVPRCVIEVSSFDSPSAATETIRDYVVTPEISWQMVGADSGGAGGGRSRQAPGLVPRIRASVERSEPGDGHWVHGSFGSGKSHFMSVLGLVLLDRPELWREQTELAAAVPKSDREWLANNPVLVVPVFMQGQSSLATALYEAVNDRLRALGKTPCRFTSTDRVIERFEKQRASLGDDAFKLLADVDLDKRTYEAAVSDRSGREELAAKILLAEGEGDTTEDARRSLYPKSLSEGMQMLSRHAVEQGFRCVVVLLDELILYLSGKSGRFYMDEINALGALVDNKSARECPIWLIVARQRNIRDTVPEDTSEDHIYDALDRLDDRFPRDTDLPDHDLTLIAQERVLRPRDEVAREALREAVDVCLSDLGDEARAALTAQWSEEDFRRLYPFHPALLQTLIDITNQLSRERTAIRVLYELLIERHPDLELGSLVPYHSLFDTVFTERGILGSSRQRAQELEAVQRTYYEELRPAIEQAFAGDEERRRRAEVVVKTILLCQLTKAFRDDVTVSRIVSLNPADLRGRIPLAAYGQVSEVLSTLANRCELVVFPGDDSSPGGAVARITIQEGVKLTTDILPHIHVTQPDRSAAYLGLMQELLGKPVSEGKLPRFSHRWRGTERSGAVRFANVSELSPSQLSLEGEFTLYIDQPYDSDPHRGLPADEEAVLVARESYGGAPIGFWLPQLLDHRGLMDLEELAKLELLRGQSEQSRKLQDTHLGRLSQDQRENVERQILTYYEAKRSALCRRLQECYLRGEAKCLFLDEGITPELDVQSLSEALGRICDAALDHLHPHHPRFAQTVQTAALRSLLEKAVLPACRAGKRLAHPDAALRAAIESVATPLEMGNLGAEHWSLNESGRYLRTALKAAEEAGATTDGVRELLQQEYGLLPEFCDFILLVLIRGLGFRAFRGKDTVAESELEFGKLRGLRLTRAESLTPVQWSQAQERIGEGWIGGSVEQAVGSPAYGALKTAVTSDLSVAAQDDLWRALRDVARALEAMVSDCGRQATNLCGRLGSDEFGCVAERLQEAARLNSEVARSREDSRAGLVWLSKWEASAPKETADVLKALGVAPVLLKALRAIESGTLTAVLGVADEDDKAKELAGALGQMLARRKPPTEAEVGKWNGDATEWVVSRVQKSTGTPTIEPGETKEGGSGAPTSITETCHARNLDSTVQGLIERAKRMLSGDVKTVTISITVEADEE